MQDQISIWLPLHLHENIHEEDIVHLKRMERKYDFNLLKGLEEVFMDKKFWSSHWGSDMPSLLAIASYFQWTLFCLNFRKPPITMYLLPHSVPLTELVYLQNLHQQV